MKEFLGQNHFVWWHGVVEDVTDPLKLGRVRVRVFGYHSDDIVELPVSSLPWAYPMQPITSAALSGIGTSPTGLLSGSHVFGFFRDGPEAQDPIVIGSFSGIPRTEVDPKKGFNDPIGKYPIEDSPRLAETYPKGVSVVGEPDINRLSRNDFIRLSKNSQSTMIDDKRRLTRQSITSVPDISNKRMWNEPETPYRAVYPKNHVRFTECGHVEEFDDTPGAERLHLYHTSGTFTEIGNGWSFSPDGTRVQRVVGDDYEIIHGNKKIIIEGKDGIDLVVRGGMNITVDGSCGIQFNGDVNLLAKANVYMKFDGSAFVSGKKMEFYADEHIAFSGKTITFKSDGSVMNIGEKIEVNSTPATVSSSRVVV